MTRWEYLSDVMPEEIVTDPAAVMAWLNERGRQGWELVNTPSNRWFTFKRAIMPIEDWPRIDHHDRRR